jgi:hypothetical protein
MQKEMLRLKEGVVSGVRFLRKPMEMEMSYMASLY